MRAGLIPPSREERDLGHVAGEGDRRVVRVAGCPGPPQPSQQICARRVVRVIPGQVGLEAVEEGESGRRPVALAHRDRAVELHDR